MLLFYILHVLIKQTTNSKLILAKKLQVSDAESRKMLIVFAFRKCPNQSHTRQRVSRDSRRQRFHPQGIAVCQEKWCDSFRRYV